MPLRGRGDPGSGSGPPKYPGTFLLAFREAAADLNWQIRHWMGQLVECDDDQGRKQVIGLENFYRRVRPLPREQWPTLIADLLRTATVPNLESAIPENLASVAEQLLVRLGPPLAPLPDEAKVWSQPLTGTGLDVNMVIDYPNRMCYVSEKLVSDSGQPGSAWLERALANLRARTPADCLQTLDEESGMRHCCVGDSYDSSRALVLDLLLPETSADGCFLAIPSRDQLFILPVGLHALSFVHFLKALAEKYYKSTPYPISDDVFWVRTGTWQRFRIDVKGKKVTIEPPAEFAEILKRLAAEDTSSGSDEPGEA